MDQARASATGDDRCQRGATWCLRAALVWDGGVWAIEGLPEEVR